MRLSIDLSRSTIFVSESWTKGGRTATCAGGGAMGFDLPDFAAAFFSFFFAMGLLLSTAPPPLDFQFARDGATSLVTIELDIDHFCAKHGPEGSSQIPLPKGRGLQAT
jgi:hypothetical protein